MERGQIGRRSGPSNAQLGWALAGGLLLALALSLSDAAPDMIHELGLRLRLADVVERWSFGVDPELIGHAMLWGAMAGVVALGLAPRARWVVPACVALLGVSVLIEEGQQRFTSVRTFQVKDIVANAAGVVAVVVIATALGGRRGRTCL